MPRPLQVALLWIITLLWVANLVIGYIDPPRAQPEVSAPFMIVAAILFRELRKRRPGGNADDEDDETPTSVLGEARKVVDDLTRGDTTRRPGDEP